jgi:hypothetical protein
VRQHHPQRASEGAGEVRGRRAHADDEVERAHQRGLAVEIVALVDEVQASCRRNAGNLVLAIAALERIPRDVLALEQRRQRGERDAAPPVVRHRRVAGPRQADAEPRGVAREPCTNRRAARRIGEQVGRIRTLAERIGAEQARQRHDRGPAIAGRNRVDGDHVGDAGCGARERRDRGLRAQQHAGAAIGERLHEADRLEHVAVALLGIDEQGLAGDIVPLAACDAGNVPPAAELGEAEARLVIGPSATVAEREARDAAIPACLCMRSIELQRLVVRGDRLVVLAPLEQRQPEVRVCARVRTQRDRATLRRDRVVEPVDGQVREAEVAVEVGLVGAARRGALESRQRLRPVAALHREDAQEM